MKMLINLLPFLLLFNCQNQDAQLVELQSDEIDFYKVELARVLADQILIKQREGSYYALNNTEATRKMIERFDEKTQRNSYSAIKTFFGEYQMLQFDRVMKRKDHSQWETYLFKGVFSSSEQQVRVTLNAEDKLIGFWIKPLNSL